MSSNNKIYRNFVTDFKPRRFADVVGQDDAISVIKRWLIKDEIPQAVLLSGAIGVGKTILAQLLAKSAACLNRKDGEFEPCEECVSCLNYGCSTMYSAIGSRIQPNEFLEIIKRAQGGGTNMSWLNEHGKWYPILVDEVHELKKQSQQDLRRELENDWSNAFIVGTAAEPDKIDNALRDRFVPLNIQPPSKQELKPWIHKICETTNITIADHNAYSVLIDKCDGRFRAMLQMLQRLRDLGLSLNSEEIRRVAEMMK